MRIERKDYHMQTNDELELAYQFVSQTDSHVFLTGKAGTGKTTFLHRVRETVGKRKVIVAPTGVAAINAKGVTIHSQFQLPFGVLSPERLVGELRKHRLSAKKADLLRRLDLLIIDEISMVRVDVLDAISAVLRKYRRSDQPFGGVQLLMIGDLHQLPPVVRDSDWDQLGRHYKTPYFFDSLELRKAGARTVQLTHIYRQSDVDFIDLLNQVRNDRLTKEGLQSLNTRYRGPDFSPPPGEDHITLTSHNKQATRINQRRLGELTTPLFSFTAEVKGTFPESMYPNEAELNFRVGAQVMFNKNDTAEQRYYNGKIGRVVAISDKLISVVCPGEETIKVEPVAWENHRYEVDKDSSEVTDEVVGSYLQHPLRLAWAITIHKSQGLTFERVIIDAADAFAYGQVYVALSRCKTFEGIVLGSRIADHSVKTDRVVSDYSDRAAESAPTGTDLLSDRRNYQMKCLDALFNFTALDRGFAHFLKSLLEHDRALQGDPSPTAKVIRADLHEKVIKIAEGFRRQLPAYGKAACLPIDREDLGERLKRAAAYLVPKLADTLKKLNGLVILSDNRKIRETVYDRLDELRLALLTKKIGLETLNAGFDPDKLLRSRTEAERAFAKRSQQKVASVTLTEVTAHPVLYETLAGWRYAKAEESGLAPFRILHNSILMSVAEGLPSTGKELLGIRGIGMKTREKYGGDLLALVAAYVGEKGDRSVVIKGGLDADTGSSQPSSRQMSLLAFRRGKGIKDIATERNLTEGTIFGHLTHYVAGGELSATDLIDGAKLNTITEYMVGLTENSLNEAYQHFGGSFTYAELKLARADLDNRKQSD